MSRNARHLAAVADDGQVPAPGTWEVPVPLGSVSTALPPFPSQVYPAWLADMVTSLATFTQTDPAMAGTVALAVLSACAGGRLEVEAKSGWREPVNVFVAVIAEPGELKSPVHGALTDPLVTAEATLAERVRPRIAEQVALRDIAERQAEQARAVAARADQSKRDDAAADAVAAALAAEAITVPTLPRLVADDATPERLVSLMAENGGRMAIISDEGGIFDTLAGRYSGTPNLDPYLKGHSGRPMGNDRQTRAGGFIRKPALTVGVMAQPSVLRRFGGNADLAGRGLPARFLVALPRSLAGWRDQDAPPIPEHVSAQYARVVHDLAATFAEWEDPAVVALTPDASAVRTQAAKAMEIELRPGGALREMAGWANKLRGTTLRLAGLLHMAHYPADAWRRPIGADTMAGAVTLTGFFVAHYRAALATISTDGSAEVCRYVLGVLIGKGMTSFTRRELHRRVARQLPRADQVAAVLHNLAQLGWVRPVDGGYELHPRAADFAATADTLTTGLRIGEPPGQGAIETVNAPADTLSTCVDTSVAEPIAVNGVNGPSAARMTAEHRP